MHPFRPWLFIFLIALSSLFLITLHPAQANASAVLFPIKNALQIDTIEHVSPSSCPAEGCAPGQRLTMRYEFPLSGYEINAEDPRPNVKICLYAPDSWNLPAKAMEIDSTGEIPGLTYTDSHCDEASSIPLSGYTVNSAREARITTFETVDSLRLSFRVPASATGSQRLKARVLVRQGDAWTILYNHQSRQIPLAQAAATAYVANDPATCGSRTPCYVNSSGDQVGGVGTGLKDAVESVAENGTIYILGNYTIKGSTVNIQRPVTLTSLAGSPGTITFSGTQSDANCTGSMLSVSSNVTIRGLTINDGGCTSKNRNLIDISAPSGDVNVRVDSNTLVNGDNAIIIRDVSGSVQVMYNHINANGGHALYWDGTSRGGALNLVANNLHGNGALINCGVGAAAPLANRRANHNYFGASTPPASIGSCTFDPAKRLGAPIVLKTGQPGVNAYRVNVTGERPSVSANPFGDQISYKQTGGQNFDLFIVDHGFATEQGLPFTLNYGRSPNPCGNYYDIFLPEGVVPANTTLELFFKYNRTIDCTAAINNSQICRALTPTPDLVPLFWYDVAATAAPTAWASSMQRHAGSEGQVTTCDRDNHEIKVEIDSSGRPRLDGDLFYTPMMAGVQVIKSFIPLAYDKQIQVVFETNAEPDIKEYYILSGESPNNLSNINGPYANSGSSTGGARYNRWETDKVNGRTYYYRLKLVRKDGSSIYSEVYSIIPNTPTPVPPPTITPTPTRTVIPPTRTPTRTLVPPQAPTRVPTNTRPVSNITGTVTQTPLVLPTVAGTLWTATPLPFLTGSPGVFPTETATITLTFGPEGSPTPTLTATLPPRMGTGTAIAMLRSQTPAATRRPTRTATPTEVVVGGLAQEQPGWLSLLLGLLVGTAITGGLAGAWWYLRTRR